MGETGVDRVGDQLFGQFIPGQKAAILHAPGAEVDLVDGDRFAARLDATPMFAMGFITPCVMQTVGGDRGGLGSQLRLKGVGVSLQRQHLPLIADDLEFVGPSRSKVGQEDFPDAGVGAQAHRISAAIPVVKITDDRDPLGIGCPHRKVHAFSTFVFDEVRAQLVEQAPMRPFGDVIVIHRPKHRAERIGVCEPPFTTAIAGAQLQRLALLDADRALEEAAAIAHRKRTDFIAL